MENIKILVVDDESRMRKLVKDFLVREGYTVLEAGDGMEAMDVFYEDKDIALIILDVMMSENHQRSRSSCSPPVRKSGMSFRDSNLE